MASSFTLRRSWEVEIWVRICENMPNEHLLQFHYKTSKCQNTNIAYPKSHSLMLKHLNLYLWNNIYKMYKIKRLWRRSSTVKSLLNGCMASALRHACAHAYKWRNVDVTAHAVSICVIAGGCKENKWKLKPSGQKRERRAFLSLTFCSPNPTYDIWSTTCNNIIIQHTGFNMTRPVFRVFNKMILKPVSSATEIS